MPAAAPPPSNDHAIAVLRLRDHFGVAWLSEQQRKVPTDRIVVHDPASGVAVVRLPDSANPQLSLWDQQGLSQPRYALTTDPTRNAVALRPLFINALTSVSTPLWEGSLWSAAGDDLLPGGFLFTNNAAFIGLVIEFDSNRLIIPATTLIDVAERLLLQPRSEPGEIGVEIAALSSEISLATGAANGVIVVRLDRDMLANEALMLGDVIEAIDGETMDSAEDWQVAMARLTAHQSVRLRVHRQSGTREVTLEASPLAVPVTTLGLTLRARVGHGSEILRVATASAAARAGLAAGDVIDLAGATQAPMPGQISRQYASLGTGQNLLIIATRGDRRIVTALQR